MFDFNGVLIFTQPQPIAQASDMRINHHADINAKCVAQHDVGRLSPDTGQMCQLVHCLWNFAVMQLQAKIKSEKHTLKELRLVEGLTGPRKLEEVV